MSLWSGLIGKIAGTAFGGFLRSYGVWILGGLAVLLAGFVTWYVYSAEKAKAERGALTERVENLNREVSGLVDLNARNKIEVNKCLAINAGNALDALIEKERMQAAVREVAKMKLDLERERGERHVEIEKLRNRDKECRTVDADLPDWFVDGMRDD